jgi:transcription elongation GreA/GreB family factor
MQLPKRRGDDEKKNRQHDRYLTAEAVARLKRDLERLEKTERPRAVEDLRRAAEMGDRSDNAAYTEARGRLTGIDSRILSLQERIKYAVVIERGPDAAGRVALGSTVMVEVNGNRKTYEILGVQETSPGRGRISYLSPLGAALMGKEAGDKAVVKNARDEDVIYEIIEIG